MLFYNMPNNGRNYAFPPANMVVSCWPFFLFFSIGNLWGGNIWWAQVGFLCEFPMQGLKSPMQPVARWRHNSSYEHEGFGIGVANPYWKRCLIPWFEVYKCFYASFNFYKRVLWTVVFLAHDFRYKNPSKPKTARTKRMDMISWVRDGDGRDRENLISSLNPQTSRKMWSELTLGQILTMESRLTTQYSMIIYFSNMYIFLKFILYWHTHTSIIYICLCDIISL